MSNLTLNLPDFGLHLVKYTDRWNFFLSRHTLTFAGLPMIG